MENPKKLLINASRKNKETGSSTLVIATIDQTSEKLKTASIGDSGYMIFRQSSEDDSFLYSQIYRSEEQQHGFNFPFQLAP